MKAPLAVFDLDGTLTRRDTFLPFLISYGLRNRYPAPLLPLPFHLASYAFRVTTDQVAKQRVIASFLRNQPTDRIADHARWFCDVWLPRNVHPLGIRALRDHQRRGHRTVLLSASPDVYVKPIARTLGIPEVVCTRVSEADGCCTGQLVGDNCKGAAKLLRLKEYLETETPPNPSFAYGNSSHDYHVLRWVHHGLMVRRKSLTRIEPIQNACDSLAFDLHAQ
jgi:HAD superfamily hydrolase (TIGR01490 family)